MHADRSVAETWILFCEFDGVVAFFEVGAGDHEFAHAGFARAAEDLFEVVGVAAFTA